MIGTPGQLRAGRCCSRSRMISSPRWCTSYAMRQRQATMRPPSGCCTSVPQCCSGSQISSNDYWPRILRGWTYFRTRHLKVAAIGKSRSAFWPEDIDWSVAQGGVRAAGISRRSPRRQVCEDLVAKHRQGLIIWRAKVVHNVHSLCHQLFLHAGPGLLASLISASVAITTDFGVEVGFQRAKLWRSATCPCATRMDFVSEMGG